jgi:8-oxoguanine deaminase
MRTRIRDPLAILAPNAPRGLVVEDDRIMELVETESPKTPCDATFDADVEHRFGFGYLPYQGA